MNPRRPLHWAAHLLAGVATLFPIPTKAAVIFTDIEDVPLFLGTVAPRYHFVDFDNDGTLDAEFRSSDADFRVTNTPTSRIAGLPARPPDQGNFAAPVRSGTPIGLTLSQPWSWNPDPSFLIGCVLLGNDVACLGFWGANLDYVGVEFSIGGQTHYGWVEVEVPFFASGGIIRSFAYETQPGVPILAGAVPEPSALLLLTSGLALPLCRRWRRPVAEPGALR